MSTAKALRLGARKIRQELRVVMEPRALRRRSQTYEADRSRRARIYDAKFEPAGDYAEVVETLRRDGYARIPGVLDTSLLQRLREELDAKMDSGEGLNKVSNDRARQQGDQAASSSFAGSKSKCNSLFYKVGG